MTDLHGNPGAMGVSAQLKAAREARGFTLDDVATRTRVPIRHLQHIEAGEWNQLPAITYTIGFVRSYANSVGLNGTELGAELRGHLGQGGDRRAGTPLYEPADPARVPPRALAIAAGLLALALVIGYLIWRTNAADEPDMLELATQAEPVAPAPPPLPAQPAPAPTTGPVILTAVSDLWLRISDAGGAKLHEGVLKAGERFEVPPTARQPQITTGRPDALRVTVGQTEIPPLGEPKRTIADVSLLPQDLLARVQAPALAQGPAQARPGQPAAVVAVPAARQRPAQQAQVQPAASQPVASQPAASPPAALPPAPTPLPAQPAPAQPEAPEPAPPPTE